MSGHSKWSNIKRRKEAQDSKKSKIFSKMSRLITVAARQCGGDPDMNPRLRLAIEKAKAARMPKDNIQRAVDKGTGKIAGATYEEMTYEGYGPEGVAFMLTVLTDNTNRTVAEIRNIFTSFGGSLGVSGSTAYIFSPNLEEPSFEINVDNLSIAKKLIKMVTTLEDNEDVQDVYSNFSISDDLLAKLENI